MLDALLEKSIDEAEAAGQDEVIIEFDPAHRDPQP
jgi:hypothetical protein